MTTGMLLTIVLIVLLIGAFPTWPYSRKWGYAPSSVLMLVVIVIIVLLLTGHFKIT